MFNIVPMKMWLHAKQILLNQCFHKSAKLENKSPPMNTHLKYLEYFKSLQAPGYAVLVTGDWGVGKTYQVRKYLSEDEHYYVSLFGLTSADEIHASVLSEADPTLAKISQVFSKFRQVSDSAGGLYAALGNVAPTAINAVLRKKIKPDKILIFDDLERSRLELKDLLGVINTYVEHYGCRVVVITHDDKLKGKFKKLKEKLFGQTILITPQVAEAFEKFVSDTKMPNFQTFANSHKDDIIRVFDESGAMSLRVLRHVVEDLKRLHGALSNDHLGNAEAMAKLVCLFCALNIEVRTGKLKENNLRNRESCITTYEYKRHAAQDGPPPPPELVKSNDKYSFTELGDGNLLNDDVLVQTLIEGQYLEDEIRGSLDNSSYFQKPEDAPPWRIICSMPLYDIATVEAAADRIQQQFDNREVTEPGEMLHIFSLKMMMSAEGIRPEGCDEVVDSCKAYINDLLRAGKLPPEELQQLPGPRLDSFGAYGYWVQDEYENRFKEIKEYMLKMRKQALENQYPDIARGLLELVRTDSQKFFEQVSHTNYCENPYKSIPVLGHIDPQEFVDVWLRSPPGNWHFICYALEERYLSDDLGDSLRRKELDTESSWFLQVLEILESEVEKSEGFRGIQIRLATQKLLERKASIKLWSVNAGH